MRQVDVKASSPCVAKAGDNRIVLAQVRKAYKSTMRVSVQSRQAEKCVQEMRVRVLVQASYPRAQRTELEAL